LLADAGRIVRGLRVVFVSKMARVFVHDLSDKG